MRPRFSTRDKAHMVLLAVTLATDLALLWAVAFRWWRT